MAWLLNKICLLLNTRVLIDIQKGMEFATAANQTFYLVFCLPETWLNELTKDAEPCLENFNLVRRDRESSENGSSRNGGALIAI